MYALLIRFKKMIRESIDGSSASYRTTNNGSDTDPPSNLALMGNKEDRRDTHSPGTESTLMSPTISESSATMTDDDEETTHSNVYESKIALYPACNPFCGKIKGKAKKGERRYSFRSTRCGSYEDCEQATLSPPTAVNKITLTTEDPLHDLKRWFTSPNSSLDGEKEPRSIDFLQREAFTDDHLRDAMLFAINEIQYEHAHIDSLFEYAARSPYNLNLQAPAALDANASYFTMAPEHFDGVPRDGLEEDIVNAATELDYLKGVAESIGRKILEQKCRVAKLGNRTEQAELVRLEVVSEEWVQDNCLML